MSISESTDKCLRLYMLLGISRKAVKVIFDAEIKPDKLVTEIRRNFSKIRKLCSGDVAQQLLGNDVRSEDLDLTLMICLLRNITPLEIGDLLPVDNVEGDAADITRIKYYRNNIVHALEHNSSISDETYTRIWEDVCKAVKRLSESAYDECINLKNSSLDLLDGDIKLMLDNAMIELKENNELNEKLNILTQQLKGNISNQIPPRILIDKQLDKWKYEDDNFLVTRGTQLVIKMIQKKNCIAIVGSFGMGKTAILRHVALYMRTGCVVVPVTDHNEIDKYNNPVEQNLFVVDNFCGKCDLDENELAAWNNVGAKFNEDCKLIVTIQLQVYRAIQSNMLTNIEFYECNLLASGIRLSRKEKQAMSRHFHIDSNDIGKDLKHYNCFPRLCTYFNEGNLKDSKTFFENPFEVYEIYLDNLQTLSSNGKLCALALLVMLNGRLQECSLLGNLPWDFEYLLANICDTFQMNKVNAAITIKNELDNLIDTYVAKKNGVYIALNEKFFDFLFHFFGKRKKESLIKYASPELLLERFQFSAPSVDKNEYRMCRFTGNSILSSHLVQCPEWEKVGSNAVILSEEADRLLYMIRMSKDFSRGYINNVIRNPNIDHRFAYQYLNCLDDVEKIQLCRRTDLVNKSTPLITVCGLYRTMDENGHVFLYWLIDNGCPLNAVNNSGETALYVASSIGEIASVKILLKYQANMNICESSGKSSLFVACENGHSKVAELLIKAGADCNTITNRGDAPLHAACRKGLTSVVKCLLKHNADTQQINYEEHKPFNIARLLEHYDIVQLFITHMVNR